MRSIRGGALPLLLGLMNGCGNGAPQAGRTSASIAVLQSGAVAVVNADCGSVSLLDPATLAVQSTINVGGEPRSLLQTASGRLLVTTYRTGEVVAIDTAAGGVISRARVCAGPYALAESPDSTWVAVSCEWDGTVIRLDAATLATSVIATGLRRPRPIAIVGTDVYVADYVGGTVHDIDAMGVDHPTSLVPSSAPSRPAFTKMSANLATAIVALGGSVYVAHVLENNTGDTSEPVADDYGTIASTNPKINPVVTAIGNAPISYAVYDGGTRVYSGPVAVAAVGDHQLLVAHVSTANVAVVDTRAGASIATYQVGFGPQGIAVDEVHGVAYVDNALDQSVSRLDLRKLASAPAGAPSFTADATLVRPLPRPYSPDALAGRRFFFDATNPHVTPAGVVACASCHPEGGDDGLVWFEHTPNITLRRRRTKNLANAKSSMAPFHWDAQFAAMADLAESTMTNLMGGDGLLVDVSGVQAYIDEVVQPAVLPPTDNDAAMRGAVLFQSVGCGACHVEPVLTDHMTHAVLIPESLTSDDVFDGADTPGLRGIFASAPYFHDGRAADLDAVLHSTMGNANLLDDPQRADLQAFLRAL